MLKTIALRYSLLSLFLNIGNLSATEYQGYHKSYTIGLSDVIAEAMSKSRPLESFRKKHKASQLLLDSEKAFFYPKISLGSDLKQFYGDATPEADKVGDVSLTVKTKLYGDAISDKIDAAENSERAAYFDVKNNENEIYYTVVTALSKIERLRLYVHKAGVLRQEMMKYLGLLQQAIDQGVSPNSDLKKADLVIARFDDAVFAQESDIERLFYELKVATEVEISEQESVGIPVTLLDKLDEELTRTFTEETAVKNNFDIISKEHSLNSTKHRALSQNEYVKLNLINETFVNYLEEDTGLSTGDLKADSYIGLRLDITLFDHQKNTTDKASFMQYLADKDNLDDEKEKIRSQVTLLQRNYKSLALKKKNIAEQLILSRKLVESQKNDLWIDRVTHHDLIESLAAYNRDAIAGLTLDLQVYDTIYDYWELKSESIF